MNLEMMNLNTEFTATTGCQLSNEEKLFLECSLPNLKYDNRLLSVNFWGKILGTESDYYIAQARGVDFIRNKSTFYSCNKTDWRLLVPVDVHLMSVAPCVLSRFSGNPSKSHDYFVPAWEPGRGDKEGTVKEEDWLSATITHIDHDAAIAPKGAYYVSPHGLVQINPSFRGLTFLKAMELSSYLHLRLSTNRYMVARCKEPHIHRVIDFLDPISEDVPKEGWSVHGNPGDGVVTLRSLLWPGMTFYHVINTPKFGQLYIGTALKNHDLPFMVVP